MNATTRWVSSVVLAAALSLACSSGGGTPAPPPAAPPAPTGVSATAGDGRITVAWPPVAGATSYAVYSAIAPGVTKGSGTRLAPATSPQAVTGLANYTGYHLVVTAIGPGGEGVESTEVQAVPEPPGTLFAPADLTGEWDLLQLSANSTARWVHGGLAVAADGTVTLLSLVQDTGPVSLPPSFDLKLAITADGTVTTSGADASGAFHGSMASGKTLIFATETEGNGTLSSFVIRKRVPGVTFSAADLASVTFAYHALSAGSWFGWEYGDGTTDASGALTIAHTWEASGAVTPPAPGFATLTTDAAGVIGYAGAPGVMSGVMSADKRSLFLLNTPNPGTPPQVQLIVVTLSRTGFTAAGLAGRYGYHLLTSGSSTAASSWSRGAYLIDPQGLVTFTSSLNSQGSTALPTSFTVAVDAGGVITRPGDASFHGQMAWSGDFYVGTGNATGDPASGVLVLSSR